VLFLIRPQIAVILGEIATMAAAPTKIEVYSEEVVKRLTRLFAGQVCALLLGAVCEGLARAHAACSRAHWTVTPPPSVKACSSCHTPVS
jgi:hypothetical protein